MRSVTSHNVIRLRTVEAATLLNVGPNMLREWEELYQFPTSSPAPNGHRQFVWAEIVALRSALLTEHSVAAAVASARANLADASADSLYSAFTKMDRHGCEGAMQSALLLRPIEGAVEDVLVRALDLLARTHTHDSPEWAFAAEFAGGWLRQEIQHTETPPRVGSILVGNASRDDVDADAVYISSLELLCRRTGCDVLTVPVRDVSDLGHAAVICEPDVLLIAGSQTADEIVVRWAYEARANSRPFSTACYRRDPRGLRFISHVSSSLPPDPLAARERLLELIDQAHPTT